MSQIYTKKGKDINIEIRLKYVWNTFLKIWGLIFELIHTAVQCSKNYFEICLKQAGAFGNNIGKEPRKPRSNWKTSIIYLLRIFVLPAIQYKW